MISLDSLSAELLHNIRLRLDLPDLMRVSSTCRRLRDTAVYEWRLFESLRFSAKARASDSALLVAQRYGSLVKELWMVLDAPECGCDTPERSASDGDDAAEESCADVEGTKTHSLGALSLLKGRDESVPGSGLILPNLEKLTIQFPSTEDFGESHAFIYWENGEPWEQELARENNGMVERILRALTQTSYPLQTATSVAILNLPPDLSPVLQSDEWRGFLGRLQRVELTLFGEERDGEFTSHVQIKYQDFIAAFHEHVFEHLTSVRRLKFHGSVHAPLGYKHFGAQLPLRGRSMPRLEDLELGNIFVGPPLLEFLEEHHKMTSGKPLSLSLENVTAEASQGEFTWAIFFDKLLEAGVAIHQFSLTMRGGSIEYKDYVEGTPWQDRLLSEYVIAAQGILETHPERRIFTYGLVGDKRGYFADHEDGNIDSLLIGDDQAAYDRFMKVVAENHRRLTTGSQ